MMLKTTAAALLLICTMALNACGGGTTGNTNGTESPGPDGLIGKPGGVEYKTQFPVPARSVAIFNYSVDTADVAFIKPYQAGAEMQPQAFLLTPDNGTTYIVRKIYPPNSLPPNSNLAIVPFDCTPRMRVISRRGSDVAVAIEKASRTTGISIAGSLRCTTARISSSSDISSCTATSAERWTKADMFVVKAVLDPNGDRGSVAVSVTCVSPEAPSVSPEPPTPISPLPVP